MLTLLKNLWRWITSMRTALLLLFILAVAAIPGAVLPQRSLNKDNVDKYLANNGQVAKIYDKLGLFDVFNAKWFVAIFILLMISLIGCIVPRSIEHWKAFRTPPTRAPKNLVRLPMHHEGTIDTPMAEVEAQAKGLLKRWHVKEFSADEDRAGKYSISAERGYARELSNLIFHLSLVLILVFAGAGKLVHYEGQAIVVTDSKSPLAVPVQQSKEFCNTSTANYDSFRAGPLFDGTGLNPFCIYSKDFSAEYLDSGQAKMFTSNIKYASGDDINQDPSSWKDYKLQVNHPLRIGGDRVYLQGHGYAPQFTVKYKNGEKRTQMVQWKPQDPTRFLSSGVMRFDPPAGMYPNLFDRRQNQLAIQGLFAPTAQWSGQNGKLLQSTFPAMQDPAVAIDIYRGDAGLDTGKGQSLWNLDPDLVHSGALQKLQRVNLKKGESVTLDDGTQVTFDGATEFANYQISHDPYQQWLAASAALMLLSLIGSLVIKRRRVFIRLTPLDDGTTHIELGGLARTDRAGWGKEFGVIARTLLNEPDPDEVEEDDLIDADIIQKL